LREPVQEVSVCTFNCEGGMLALNGRGGMTISDPDHLGMVRQG
jgi:hypothetical protein